MRRSDWRGVKRGRSAPNRSMSYADIESDMNSMAQHAVANGYGKIEYLRAQPIARSSFVTTTDSASSESSVDVARRGRTVEIGFAMDLSRVSAGPSAVKERGGFDASRVPRLHREARRSLRSARMDPLTRLVH